MADLQERLSGKQSMDSHDSGAPMGKRWRTKDQNLSSKDEFFDSSDDAKLLPLGVLEELLLANTDYRSHGGPNHHGNEHEARLHRIESILRLEHQGSGAEAEEKNGPGEGCPKGE